MDVQLIGLSEKTRGSEIALQWAALALGLCVASLSFADQDTDFNSLGRLTTQWRHALAVGELSELLPLYAKSDQDKVAKAFPWLKTGQIELPFMAEMVDGQWVMRTDELSLPETAPPAAALPAQPPTPTTSEWQTYSVSLADANFRKVLKRWASAAGWIFEPEHWSVHRDIPVSGNDAVMSDFKTAVRRLLKSTLLTEMPLQPCFYSNKVLRVIPAAELCARSEN